MSGTEARAAAPAQRGGEMSDNKKEKSMTIRQQNMGAVKGKLQIPYVALLLNKNLSFRTF